MSEEGEGGPCRCGLWTGEEAETIGKGDLFRVGREGNMEA